MNRSICLSFSLAILAGCSTPSDDSHAFKSAKVHTELAGLYYQRAQLGIAMDELTQALQSDDSYAPAYSVRGLVHMALREDKEAEEDFLHSLRLDSTSPETHNNYGWFLCQRGREQESVKMFLAAVKDPLYSTPEIAWLNAGICSQKAGELKDAEEFLQKAILLKPDLPDAMLALAELEFAKGDYPDAKSHFLRYARDNNALTAGNLWLGVRIERGLGDKSAEDSYALQLRKRFPGSPESRLLPAEQ